MSPGSDPMIADWPGMPSPLGPGESTFVLSVRDGFWRHVQRHVGNPKEVALWREWLGRADADAIRWLAWHRPPSERRAVLERGTRAVEASVRASFSLPLVVLCRTGASQRQAAAAPYTSVAVLANGAKFVAKERKHGVLAAACYFSLSASRSCPRAHWWRSVAWRIILDYQRPDADTSQLPEAAQVFSRTDWEGGDRFRTAVTFVTPESWGFDGSGKPRPISRFRQFASAATRKPAITLRPRPTYRHPEDRS